MRTIGRDFSSIREHQCARAAVELSRDWAHSTQTLRLPRETRGSLERFFLNDFSHVHLFSSPDTLALGARAFACGENIFFAPGQYNPDSSEGMFLLGHEFAHVVQQRNGAAGSEEQPLSAKATRALETEADAMGLRLVALMERNGQEFSTRLASCPSTRQTSKVAHRNPGTTAQFLMLASGVFGGSDPNKRASQPRSWVRTVKKPDINWKYHHVIAWEALRDTWQALLKYQCWDALQNYMEAVGVSGASQIRGKLHRSEDLNQLERDDVYQNISWPSWNIVEGPEDRADEGGSDLDLFNFGMSSDDKMRHTDIDLLWKEMKMFLDKLDRKGLEKERSGNRDKSVAAQIRATYDQAILDAAARVSRALAHMGKYKQAPIIPYIASMWQVVTAGYVNKQFPATWTTFPTFEKADARRNEEGQLPVKIRCTACRQIFDTPNVVIGANFPCPGCGKFVYIDFKNESG